jgi:lactoylglutathione lyase
VSVRAWYDAHPRFKLHFVPTSSSWLKLVESVFADLTKRRLRRGTFPVLITLSRPASATSSSATAIRSPLSGRRLSTASWRSCAVVCALLRRSTRAHRQSSQAVAYHGDMDCVRARFELFVVDVDTTIKFYEDVLGFSATRHESGYVALNNGNVEIGLGLLVGLPENHHFRTRWPSGSLPGLGVEIVLEVDEVEGFFKRAKDQIHNVGGQIQDIANQPWGLRDFRVIDPDGYYVRVTESKST